MYSINPIVYINLLLKVLHKNKTISVLIRMYAFHFLSLFSHFIFDFILADSVARKTIRKTTT